MKHINTLLLAAALALAGACAAQAFTFESTAPGDGGGVTRNYTDPDSYLKPNAGSPQNFNGGSQSSSQDGVQVQFHGQSQSFDQKYNPNDYFSPMRQR